MDGLALRFENKHVRIETDGNALKDARSEKLKNERCFRRNALNERVLGELAPIAWKIFNENKVRNAEVLRTHERNVKR